MVYDTGNYPDHKCGKVLDYCLFNNARILFCVFCKKVIGAKPEPMVNVTVDVYVMDAKEQKKYSKENLEKWV